MSHSSLLASRLSLIAPSPTLAISARAKALAAAGHDVVSFAAGEPDFETPAHIVEATRQALERGETKYTSVLGTPALRQAVIDKFQRDAGFTYAMAQVMVACGGKQILLNALQSLVNAGDEVLIPVPYWVSYPDMVRLCGGTPVFVKPAPGHLPDHLTVTAQDLAQAITPRTKVIILNQPNNPAGYVMTSEALKAIAELAVHHGLLLISDEIYEKLVYGGRVFTSMASFLNDMPALSDHLLIAHGVAKAYSMTGFRVGFCAGPAWLIEGMAKVQGASTSHPTSFAQAGAAAALNAPQACVETMRQAFEARGHLMFDLLSQIPGVQCTQPQGAFYMFINIEACLTRLGVSEAELCRQLLESHFVAVVPGSEFGMAGYLRLSFALGEAKIREGAARLARVLGGL